MGVCVCVCTCVRACVYFGKFSKSEFSQGYKILNWGSPDKRDTGFLQTLSYKYLYNVLPSCNWFGSEMPYPLLFKCQGWEKDCWVWFIRQKHRLFIPNETLNLLWKPALFARDDSHGKHPGASAKMRVVITQSTVPPLWSLSGNRIWSLGKWIAISLTEQPNPERPACRLFVGQGPCVLYFFSCSARTFHMGVIHETI